MPGATNFLQWNPNANNMETDQQYSADTQRSGGAVSGIYPSSLHNKLMYQVTQFMMAFINSLVAKGYTMTDSDMTGMQAVFASLVTGADKGTVTKAALLQKTGYQGITTQAAVVWTSAVYDDAGFWSGTNPTRTTIPANQGITRVRLISNGSWAANASGSRVMAHEKNGSPFIGMGYMGQPAATDQIGSNQNISSAIIPVQDGDYFETVVAHSAGGSLNFGDSPTDNIVWMFIASVV